MKAWANDPMEVYAENISYCTLGVKKMPGIRYVKRSKCGAIMATYRKAIATGKPYRTPPAAPARAKSSTHKSVKSSHAKHSKTQVKKKSKKHSSKKHSSKKAKKHSSKKSTKRSSKKHSSKKHKKHSSKKAKKHSSKKHSAKKHVKKSRKKRGRRAEPRTYAIVPIARPSEAKVLLTHRSHLMHASFIMHTRQAESFGILDPGKFVLIVER